MTDTTNSTAAPTTTATTADSSAAASTATTATVSTEPTNQTQDKTEPSSSTPASGSEAAPILGAPEKDSAKDEPAQGDDKADADKPADGDQPSDDKKPEDADKEGEDGKDKEEGKDEAQPMQYEAFTVPEGLVLDQDALNEALPVLQELKAPQEQAQKLIDVASTMISKAMKQNQDQHNAVVTGWRNESKEIFGKDGDAKFQERVGAAESVVKQFFNEDQRSILTAYGLGNHPAFFAMALAISEGTREDTLDLPGQRGGLQGEKTLAETWYGDK